jgi:hypothetical protein
MIKTILVVFCFVMVCVGLFVVIAIPAMALWLMIVRSDYRYLTRKEP